MPGNNLISSTSYIYLSALERQGTNFTGTVHVHTQTHTHTHTIKWAGTGLNSDNSLIDQPRVW